VPNFLSLGPDTFAIGRTRPFYDTLESIQHGICIPSDCGLNLNVVHESLSFVDLSGSHLEGLSFNPVYVKQW
jgi:hypothetical protein